MEKVDDKQYQAAASESNLSRLTARANQPFELELKSLIGVADPGCSRWCVPRNIPSWLKLDEARGVLWGTPTHEDVGTRTFCACLTLADGRAVRHRIELKVPATLQRKAC